MANTTKATTTPAPSAPEQPIDNEGNPMPFSQGESAEQPQPAPALTDAERDELAALRRERDARLAAVALPVAPEQRTDTTVPGGRYLVGDTFVDCDGKPLKDQGK